MQEFQVEADSAEDARSQAWTKVDGIRQKSDLGVRLISVLSPVAQSRADKKAAQEERMAQNAKRHREAFDRGYVGHQAGCPCADCNPPAVQAAHRDLAAAEKNIRSAQAGVEIRERELQEYSEKQLKFIAEAKTALTELEGERDAARARLEEAVIREAEEKQQPKTARERREHGHRTG